LSAFNLKEDERSHQNNSFRLFLDDRAWGQLPHSSASLTLVSVPLARRSLYSLIDLKLSIESATRDSSFTHLGRRLTARSISLIIGNSWIQRRPRLNQMPGIVTSPIHLANRSGHTRVRSDEIVYSSAPHPRDEFGVRTTHIAHVDREAAAAEVRLDCLVDRLPIVFNHPRKLLEVVESPSERPGHASREALLESRIELPLVSIALSRQKFGEGSSTIRLTWSISSVGVSEEVDMVVISLLSLYA